MRRAAKAAVVRARRIAAAGCMAGVVCLASGCADWRQLQAGTPQVDALLAAPLPGLPRRIALTDTPFFAQEVAQCGPAALATVLVHSGVATQPDALVSAVYTPGREGSLQADMLTAARRHGRLAVRVAPRLDALLREVVAGRPVVVLLNPSLAAWPRWHYAVVVGHDLDAGTLTLRSGREREAVWPLRAFVHAWQRSAQWGFVVTRPEQPPATASLADLTEAVAGLARVQPPEVARAAYGAAQALWPRSPVLALGVAQSWADARQWPQAVVSLRHSVALGGGAPALNNLAMALWHAGEAQAAREVADQAVAQARRHEPVWLAATEATRREVSGDPVPLAPAVGPADAR